MANLYIGTSAFVYPHWKGIFYPSDIPQKEWLKFYSNYFNTVEINATFYRQMKSFTVNSWQQQVPKEFVFSIKASRFITHIKRLKECRGPLEVFFQSISPLEKRHRKHVVLFQLPPRWNIRSDRLQEFVSFLPDIYLYAFEFRDQSWFSNKVYEILKKTNCALVITDSPSWPSVPVVTTNFVYLRLHGKEMLYSSEYSIEELKKWTNRINSWINKKLDVYVYFNNDVGGYAVKNAKSLKHLTCDI